MKYLLDANIISALVIDPRGKVAARLDEVGQTNVFTSIIVNAEVAFGVKKGDRTSWRARLVTLSNVCMSRLSHHRLMPNMRKSAPIWSGGEN